MSAQCFYFGCYAGKEVQMIKLDEGLFQIIAEATGLKHDEEGAKTVWKTLAENERYEVQYPGI